MMTDEEFSLKLKEMEAGYQLWKNLIVKYNLSQDDYVIAFPHRENLINKYGFSHLKQFITYKHARRILILSVENNHILEQIYSEMDKEKILIEMMSEEEMDGLVTCYSINTLSSHFIMMSLTKPYGRYGDKILQKGITLDEVVTVGIYQMTEKEIFDKSKN